MQDTVISTEDSIDIHERDQSFASSSWRAWVVCLSAALFFFYEFMQLNMFNAISTQLMQAFSVNATQLGAMNTAYFIANVVFLFPAGMLLDRYSARKIILISLAICIAGLVCFSFTISFFWAFVARFMAGIGSAFCFLSVIRLSTRWFPSARLALVTGVIVTMAMLGGMVAQTPMTLLTQAVSWRTALLIDAILGVMVFMLIFWVVRDYPPSYQAEHMQQQKHIKQIGYWKSMGLAFLKIQNWLGGIYSCLMNLPIALIGGIWGILYLMNMYSMPKLDASYVTSLLFFGTIVGSPIMGWASDKIGLRRLPMMLGAVTSLGLVLIVMLVSHLSLTELMVLFFLIGLTTSTQIIGYPTVAENSIPAITAMSVSTVNITVMGGQGFVFIPLFGVLMDMHAKQAHHALGTYAPGDFHWAMLILPIALVIAFFASFCLRETYCQPRSEGQDADRNR